MCKLMSIIGINDDNRKDVLEFVSLVTPNIITTGCNMDGFGYMAINKNGELFGEKWLKPYNAFTYKDINEDNYLPIGSVDLNNVTTICLHARYATCSKDFKNVHPFVEGYTSLIHNGMISNHLDLVKKYSTCDSEVILHEYLRLNVNKNHKNIKQLSDKLNGYYSVAILSRNEENTPILDIFKQNGADLCFTYIDQLKSIVYCSVPSILYKTMYELKWTHMNPIYKLTDGYFIRLNAITGKVINKYKFLKKKPLVIEYGD